jgi:hypothetical protein
MNEQEPQFTVVDRRKITREGDVRQDAPASEPAQDAKPSTGAAPSGGIHAVPPPSGKSEAPADDAANEQHVFEGPSAEESAQSHAAYTATTQQMDDILRDKIPGGQKNIVVGFEHVIQSFYMTAMMQLGAGTPQGEKARIDLMGARQTIDMMEVLAKKTSGNLTENEKLMLDSALFEARMMFLEITNAIARGAAQQSGPGVHPLDPKSKR